MKLHCNLNSNFIIISNKIVWQSQREFNCSFERNKFRGRPPFPHESFFSRKIAYVLGVYPARRYESDTKKSQPESRIGCIVCTVRPEIDDRLGDTRTDLDLARVPPTKLKPPRAPAHRRRQRILRSQFVNDRRLGISKIGDEMT